VPFKLFYLIISSVKTHLKNYIKPVSYLTLALILTSSGFAQDTTKSLAFKNNKPIRHSPYFYRPDLGYQIWQQFKLTLEANTGDVLAQHELGLRFLLGEGMSPDTLKAVYWIKKAANQNLAAAQYNFAILLINGWGIDWDPFSAFKYFKKAARSGMIQAQYVIGILNTDNLIVKRDLNYAYYWINRSSSEGYEPASKLVTQLEHKISQFKVDSIAAIEERQISYNKDLSGENNSNLTSPVGLVFIDFESVGDTITSLTDSMLIADLHLTLADSMVIKMNLDSLKFLTELATSDNIAKLLQLAESGSPEAQTIIGQLYEQGIFFDKNDITAAAYYFRALRIDSHKSRFLLWQLSKNAGFLTKLQNEAKNYKAEAMFVWYGLNSINYDNQLAVSDAVNLLRKSADDDYIPAMIELGLKYYTGRIATYNFSERLDYWEKAASMGSTEATVRLITATIYDNSPVTDYKFAFEELKKASENGSVLAQVTLAYCYENGIGTAQSKSETVNYYRIAARRGSQYAYRELQRLYDEIRPNEPEFSLN